jgi:hypothetical protein
MDKTLAIKFLNEYTAVGVDNIYDKTKLFYYFGLITDVNDTFLVIETKTNVKEVRLSEVREIRLDRQRS